MHRFDRCYGIQAVMTRHLKFEDLFQVIHEPFRHFFKDAHGAISLHITMSTHRAETSALTPHRCQQEMDVHHFLNGCDGVLVLRETHRPAGDQLALS